MIDELISRIVDQVGISDEVAKSAVGIIINFLQTDGPSEQIEALMGSIPGAADLANAAAEDTGGGGGLLGGLMGAAGGLMGGSAGGAMAAFTKLQSTGLDLNQVQSVTSEFVSFAKEKAGADTVNEIVKAIPGLDQFI